MIKHPSLGKVAEGRKGKCFRLNWNDYNVKVADVAWASDERADVILDEVSASVAPEICVEVRSDGNTSAEMEFKKTLFSSWSKGGLDLRSPWQYDFL